MTPPGVGRPRPAVPAREDAPLAEARPDGSSARAFYTGDWPQALRVLSEGAESLPGNRFPQWHRGSVLTGMLAPCEYPSIVVIIIPNSEHMLKLRPV